MTIQKYAVDHVESIVGTSVHLAKLLYFGQGESLLEQYTKTCTYR